MNILFTCAGRRHYLIDYFQKAKPEGFYIVGADMQSTAPAMALVDKRYIVPPVYDPKYLDSLLEICRNEKIGAIISLNDLELPILSNGQNQFEENGVQLIVSSTKVIDICFDKWRTVEFAKQIGVKTPKTYLRLDQALSAIERTELKFPVVIKPRWGSASIGIEFPENIEELKFLYTHIRKKVLNSMLGNISNTDIENSIIIQEKIEGKEYGLDILNNFEGEVLAVVIKEKISMRSGETDKAITRKNKYIKEIGEKIGDNLGHIANLDCDLFEKDGEYYLLEMNPRFGGGYPFSQMSGTNFPAVLYSLLNNQTIQENWLKPTIFDKVFAKCDILINVTDLD